MVSAAPVQTRREVLDRLAGQRAALRALGLRRLGLFGSFRHDRPHPDSDVDLLVEFEAGATTLGNIMEVAELLEAVLGRRVEIVPADALSPYIGPKILADAEDIPLAP
ncbi:MAG TPA: nucleotidyltransferase domain-containing protein [Rubricoccaceae bacterium]|nr:nucleotidyltransferase domain-containing protein [Rubricoccaceae bacterium]